MQSKKTHLEFLPDFFTRHLFVAFVGRPLEVPGVIFEFR